MMVTVGDYIQQAAARFEQAELCYGHGTDNSQDEAFYLVYAGIGLDFSNTALFDRELSAAETTKLDHMLQQRIEQREPVAYITGQAWFAGHRFHADRRALIPRSPFAELIMNRFEPLLSHTPHRILDLCTGGGCIGIAAALEFTEADVVLADISSDALDLAAMNIALYGLDERVSCVRSDLFERLQGEFDLIVCNPPYVSQAEIDDLPAEFAREPVLGLLSGDEGLQIPLQILRDASDYLTDEGLLVMEVGYSHDRLTQRLREVPLLWLEFEQGGEGVFAITTSQLRQYRNCFC